ncbi:MAG: terminase gpA endonuclease subunit [Candidatus Paceibacterota bacterium]|jgi:phage terminase large subunit GpA-like protein
MTIPARITVTPDALWYPASLRGSGSGSGPARVYRFSFSDGERRILRKKKQIPVSQWAERHRHVTMSALPGPWRNEVTPYLAGIMDASYHDAVQTIIVCKTPQTGVTESVLNCLGYAIDRDPGPALCVFPDQQTSKENMQDRIIPMIDSSPRLRSYYTGADDDRAVMRIKLRHMPIYCAWASSVARLGNKPIKHLILDELDKYIDRGSSRETSPEALAEKRTITYRWNRKIWKISTPTIEQGPIWQAFTKEAQCRFDYWVRCPVCGEMQLMRFARDTFRWPEGERDPARIDAESLAWYECEHCHGRWNDTLRDQAVRAGEWRERETGVELFTYLNQCRPKKIGFHIPSWISYFVPLSEIAAAFLLGQNDLDAFKDFKNGYEGLPWKQIIISSDIETVLRARCELPPQVVPVEAATVLAGIDTQKYGFWFAVRAFALDYTSWLIHYGFLPEWEDLERLLFDTAYPIDGNETKTKRIARACIDTGGGKKYENMSRTEEVYWWLRDNGAGRGCRVWGTKGSSRALEGKLQLGKPLDKTPSGKALPGGLRLISVDTLKVKDMYHYRLNRAIEGLPQGAYLHAGTGEDYARQILAEEKQITERGIEEWVQIRADNHLFDCDCLAMLAADPEFPGGGINLLRASSQSSGSSRRRIISRGI